MADIKFAKARLDEAQNLLKIACEKLRLALHRIADMLAYPADEPMGDMLRIMIKCAQIGTDIELAQELLAEGRKWLGDDEESEPEREQPVPRNGECAESQQIVD